MRDQEQSTDDFIVYMYVFTHHKHLGRQFLQVILRHEADDWNQAENSRFKMVKFNISDFGKDMMTSR